MFGTTLNLIADIITKWILPLVTISSLLFAIISFRISNKKSKIEEIHIILDEMCLYYPLLMTLYRELKVYYKEDISDETQKKVYERYIDIKKDILENHLSNDNIKKINRINLLSKAYLPKGKKIQLEVLSLSRMFIQFTHVTLGMQWIVKGAHWKTGFPSVPDFDKYVNTLQDNLINEIGFSKTVKNSDDKLIKYTENSFKNNFKLY